MDPANPQTWNRYAYVANNPLNSIDPLGLKELCPGRGGKPEDCDPVFRFGSTDLFGGIGSLSVLTAPYQYQSQYVQGTQVTSTVVFNGSSDTVSSTFTPGYYTASWSGTTLYSGGGFYLGQSNGGWQAPQSNRQLQPTTRPAQSNIAGTGQPQPQPRTQQQQNPQHFWQKPGCSSALGELGIGLAGSAITGGALVASSYLGPEIYEGLEGLMTISHVATVGAPGLLLTVQGAAGVKQNCF